MSNLLSSLKKAAKKSGINIFESPESIRLYTLFNQMFYLQKDKEKESAFVHQVITRGQEGEKRVGLHASSVISEPKDFCLREQVLSLIYEAAQGEELPVNVKRIFEEGNAIHEKWQRLFLRAGYSEVKDLDFTQYKDEWMLSFTPDIICELPDFGKMVGEIKSVNPTQFEKMDKHPTASKQLQWYMYLTGIHKGFVLNDNKGNQDFKIEYYEFDEKIVEPFIERAKRIINAYHNFTHNKHMVPRIENCKNENTERCLKCRMREACFNIGKGRVRIK